MNAVSAGKPARRLVSKPPAKIGTDPVASAMGEAVPSKLITAVNPPASICRARHVDEAHDPFCVMLQAQAIAEIAANDAATDLYWAIVSLAEKCAERAEKAQSALQSGQFSIELHEAASNELAGLVGLLRALNNDAVDDVLLYALETLLLVAKAQIDADCAAHLGRTQ